MKIILMLTSLLAFNVMAGPVNINSADASTLAASLQGIGQKKAEDIVRYRDENGMFKTADDLTNIKGIGNKTIDKNRDDILLADPKPTKKSP